MPETQPSLTNCISHTEFATSDLEATKAFFTSVLGVTFDDMSNPGGPYFTFQSPNGTGGAIRPLMADNGETPQQVPYYSVEDLDASVARAAENGGTIIVPKQPVPGMGYFSWVQIPGGNTLALWQDDEAAAPA